MLDTAHGKGLKLLTPEQMLQIFQIALAQAKAGNTSENLLNELSTYKIFFVLSKQNNYKSFKQYNELDQGKRLKKRQN